METAMDPQRFQLIDRTLEAVLEHPAGERPAFVEKVCGADADLRREVEELLRAEKEEGDFLARPLDGDDVAQALGGEYSEADEDRVGPYRLAEVLGEGGAAIVYRAFADGDGREVAVKVSRMSWTRVHARRFGAEREILARLVHPGITRYLDGGVTCAGRPYMVMEYVNGVPIDRYCDTRRLGITNRLELFCDVCLAVAHAHTEGVVHRDIKPRNVLVTSAGRTVPGRVKLLDFGIAKLLEPERFAIDFSRTSSGHRVLTPGYASPEQIDGEAVTPASDVYSLGVVLFELLTGRCPYRFDNTWPVPLEIIDAVCERPPWTLRETLDQLADDPDRARQVCRARAVADLAKLRRQVPALEGIVARALEKEPWRRYRSAVTLAKALSCDRRGG